MTRVNAEGHLVGHYRTLGDLKSDFRNYNLFNLIAKTVRGQTVVDIGCGVAYLLNILKEKGKEVAGIEPSLGMRTLAHKINPKVPVIDGLAEEIDKLIKEPVETVLMIDVLEHVEKDVEQVKKINSVLKIGGEFIFVVPAYPSLYGKRDKAMGHFKRYSKKELRRMLTSNGFYVEQLRYWNALGFLPYVVSEKILQKPLNSNLRSNKETGGLAGVARGVLNMWFKFIENNFDLGFGLSIIGVARKTLK